MCTDNAAMATDLSFILLKINGFDVSHLTQDDTVKMFLKAQKESILIEVQRKGDHDDDNGAYVLIPALDACDLNTEDDSAIAAIESKVSISTSSIAVDELSNHCVKVSKNVNAFRQKHSVMLSLKLRQAQLKSGSGVKPAYQISKYTQTDNSTIFFGLEQEKQQQQQSHIVANESAERLIEEERNLFEQCLAPEIDIEEITLRKSASNERLGLTVCYSVGEINNSNSSAGSGRVLSNNVVGNNAGAFPNFEDSEAFTEVYISDIQHDSIAGRDGRLRQGDQILQINGKDIKNKDETEALIAENCNAVTLLVSRYLCADEDDFNEPSVLELVEDVDGVDVVEDDEEEEEEYYNDNNLAYKNCYLPTQKKLKNVVEELDEVLLQAMHQQQMQQQKCEHHDNEVKPLVNDATTTISNKNKFLIGKKTVNFQRETDHFNVDILTAPAVKEKSTTIAQTKLYACDIDANDAQKLKPIKINSGKRSGQHSGKHQITTALSKTFPVGTCPSSSNEYDNEHIYETIPEDLESEPFYCSPYDNSMYVTAVGTCSSTIDALQLQQLHQQQHQQQKQQLRVAQWLGINSQAIPENATATTLDPTQVAARTTDPVSSGSKSFKRNNDTVRSVSTTITNGSSSSDGTTGVVSNLLLPTIASEDGGNNVLTMDERDNSSSAYNTGGSHKSGSPFNLQNNHPERASKRYTNPAPTAMENEITVTTTARNNNRQQYLQSPKDKKIPGSKNSSLLLLNSKVACHGSSNADVTAALLHQHHSKVLYGSETATHQSLQLQQHLYRQLQHPEQMHMLHFPEFIAPNLSQYHFVSSQEVSTTHNVLAASGDNSPHTLLPLSTQRRTGLPFDEDGAVMVWKVKRRPDGTRYIVRRPATNTIPATIAQRNRVLRTDRTLRMRTRDNGKNVLTTTTEDDTISEVKTGRYWSREERKKHIERARERRQHHLLMQQELQRHQGCNNSFISTMRISDQIAKKLQHQQQHLRVQHQQQVDLYTVPRQMSVTPKNSNTLQQRPQYQQYYKLQFKSVATTSAQQPVTNDMLLKMPTSMFMSSKSCTKDMQSQIGLDQPTINAVTSETIVAQTPNSGKKSLFFEPYINQPIPNTNQQQHLLGATTTDVTNAIRDLQPITNV